MENVLLITKALADNNRLRIIMALKESSELCACQIIELLEISGATVSRHLSILQNAGLLQSRKDGHWMHYRLVDDNVDPMAREALDWISHSLKGSKESRKDIRRLKTILKTDPEMLCARQRKN